jgi:hypothetical protein
MPVMTMNEEKPMYMVYWTTRRDRSRRRRRTRNPSIPVRWWRRCSSWKSLRARQRAGEAVRFITMCSEHPDVVGHPGVDVTGPGYDWKKRRR